VSLLAAVVGVVLLLRSGASPACAAPPTGSAVHTGKATFYTLASGGGNCSYPGPPADRMYVALSPGEYAAAAACGGYLDVTGPKGTVRAQIVDLCPECPAGHVDLSREAFARIADPVRGVVPVTYRAAVNPRLPGPLTFRIKDGASQWWFAVLVGNHGNPLRSVEVKPAGQGWQRLTRTDYNYWLRDSGLGSGPFAVRVTDVYGRRTVASGIALSPERTQRTSVFMYGRSAPRPAPGRTQTRRPTAPPPATATVAPTGATGSAPAPVWTVRADGPAAAPASCG